SYPLALHDALPISAEGLAVVLACRAEHVDGATGQYQRRRAREDVLDRTVGGAEIEHEPAAVDCGGPGVGAGAGEGKGARAKLGQPAAAGDAATVTLVLRCVHGQAAAAQRDGAAGAGDRLRHEVVAVEVEGSAIDGVPGHAGERVGIPHAQGAVGHRHRADERVRTVQAPGARAVADEVANARDHAADAAGSGEAAAQRERVDGVGGVEDELSVQRERAAAVIEDRALAGDQPGTVAAAPRTRVAQEARVEGDVRARAERAGCPRVRQHGSTDQTVDRRPPGERVGAAEDDVATGVRGEGVGTAAQRAQQREARGFSVERPADRYVDVAGDLQGPGALVANDRVVAVDVPIAIGTVAIADVDDVVAVLALLVEDDGAVGDRGRRAQRAGLTEVADRREPAVAHAIAAVEDRRTGVGVAVVRQAHAAVGGDVDPAIAADQGRSRTGAGEGQRAAVANGDRSRRRPAVDPEPDARAGRGADVVAGGTERGVAEAVQRPSEEGNRAAEGVRSTQLQGAATGLDQPRVAGDHRVDPGRTTG